MAAPNPAPSRLLGEEILAEASRQSEALLRDARQQADSLLAQARAEADELRQKCLARARAEAERQAGLILATIPLEAGRLRLNRLEALLDSIHEEICGQLRTGEGVDYRAGLVALAGEALSGMEGDSFTLHVGSGFKGDLGEDFTRDVARQAGRTPLAVALLNAPPLTEPGVVVRDVEGRQLWDNRLVARLERLWPEMRRQMAARAGLLESGLRARGVP